MNESEVTVKALAEELAAAIKQQSPTSELLPIIERSSLFKKVEACTLELSDSLQQQSATAEVLKTVSRSTFDLPTVLNDLVASALELCKSSYGGISLREGDRLRVAAVVGGSPEWVPRERELKIDRSTISGRVALSGQLEIIPDIELDLEYEKYSRIRFSHARALMGVPLMREGNIKGVLYICRPDPGTFTERQRELVQTFADQAVIAIENARLFEEAQQRNRELTATSDVLKVISRSPTDVLPVFDAVAESAAKLCEAYDAIIFVKKGDDLVVGAHHGPIPMDWTSRKISRHWFTGRAVIDRVLLHVRDLLAEGEEFPESRADALRQGHRTILAVPLLTAGEAIGALVIRRLEVRPFTDKQIELLQTFADQSVIAIKNVRQFDEIAERNWQLSEALEQQTATSAVLRVIAASPTDIQPVLDAVVESAARLCGSQDALIVLEDGDRLTTKAHYGAIPVQRISHPINRDSVIGRAFVERQPVQVVDMFEAADEFPLGHAIARRGGFRTVLALPLLREGEAIGAIAIRRLKVQPFTQKQIDLLATFADQAVIAIENVRLFQEVQARTSELEARGLELSESLQQQTATADVLKVISRSTFNLKRVLDTLTSSAVMLCNAEYGFIFLRDKEEYRAEASAGVSEEFLAFQKAHPVIPGRQSMVGRVALSGVVEHIPDRLADPEYSVPGLDQFSQMRAGLGVPLLREGRVEGVFALGRTQPEPFTARQIQLVQTFADQAVIAIENVRLFDEVQTRTAELTESLQQQTATADVLKVISRSAFDLKLVLQTLVESASRLCDAEMGAITRQIGDKFYRAEAYGMSPESVEHIRAVPVEPDRSSAQGRVLLEGRVIHIPDIQADPDYAFEQAKRDGVRTVLGVPMMREGVAIGSMGLARSTVRPFTDKQIELVSTFADQAAIAIENARLFEEVQARTRELTEALQQQTATAEVLKAISRSTFDLQLVLNTLVQSSAGLCGANVAQIFRFDGNMLSFAAGFALNPEYEKIESTKHYSLHRGSLVGRVSLERRTIVVLDALADPEYDYKDDATVGNIRTMLGVPLMQSGELIGVLAVARDHVEPFTEKQIALVTTFADQAVIAIRNVRLFEEVQARTAELSESLQQQIATADVLKVISRSAFDLQTVLDTLTSSAAELCGADMGSIARQKGDGFYYSTNYNLPADWQLYVKARRIAPERGSVLGRSLLERKVVHVADVLADPEYTFLDDTKTVWFRTVLGVPLMREGIPIGVIVLARRNVSPFSEKQIELVQTFADQAVIAMENARLFDEVQSRTRELTESLQQQTATAEVLKVISRSAFDLKTVLQTLIESAARLCDADTATITRQIDGAFVRAETYGAALEFVEQIRGIPVLPDRRSAQGRALLEGKVIHITDIESDPEYSFEGAKRLGARTILGVPMMREGTPIGSMALARSEVRPFSDKQIELVSTFADQAAIAIENVRLFESVEARTRELGRSLENLRSAQDRLIQTEKLASLGQLTAGIAHEIKNPLNFVNNFSALSVELVDELQQLTDGLQTDQQRAEARELMATLKSNLDKVSQHGKRADSIVKNMLLHSRQGSSEHRPADINAIVEESLNLAYHGARAEKQGFNITLEKSFDREAGKVDLFPQEITRVFLNLISNGFYATAKRRESADPGYEPVLSAATRNLGDRVEIRIRDNGTGIPAEIRTKLFTPFFTTKPAGEGTGLGLSLSHDIIAKQHAGSISVESEFGEYTEFVIVLPRDAASLAQSGGYA